MRKSLFACMALACGFSAFAQLNGDGYYRIQNYMSERYAYVVNDKGKINVATTSADLSSIALWSDESKALSDPSTVIYLKNVEGNKYNLIAQNTSMYDIIGHYLQIKDNGNGTYKAYAEQSGMVIYIGDAEQSGYEKGTLATNTKGDWRNWYIKPVDGGDASYLGVKPDIEVDGKYYKSYYASFPFTITSKNVKAYYVKLVNNSNAAFVPIESDKVPAGTPIYFECTSSDQSQNRILPTTDNTAAITDNILTGVYFDFASGSSEKRNQVTYDPTTMRVLGKMSDGSLGFITASNLTTIPANTVYLKVPATAAAEIKLVSEENYKEDEENNNTEDPGNNNGTDDPNNGNSTDDPNNGNSTDDPNNGNSTDDPNNGNSTDDPNNGNSTDDPNNGNGTDDPNNGNSTDDPNNGNSTDDPNNGNSTDDPNNGNSTDDPNNGNSTDDPNNGEDDPNNGEDDPNNGTEDPGNNNGEDDPGNAGVVDLSANGVTTFDVYTTTGIRVRHNVSVIEGLPAGIYIVNGRKLVVRP